MFNLRKSKKEGAVDCALENPSVFTPTVDEELGSRKNCTYVQGFLDLHVKSLAIYVWRLPMCRSAQNDRYAAQTNLTPDPTLTLTLTPTQPSGGLSVCSRGRQGLY